MPCFSAFCASSWLRDKKESNSKNDVMAEDNDMQILFQLVKLHIIERKEVYTLSQLRSYYESIKNENSASLRSIDLKEKLLDHFGSDIQFQAGKRSEYVLPTSANLTSECINATICGEGIPHALAIRNSAKIINKSIKERQSRGNPFWPPTPQDIMDSKCAGNIDLFNHIAWMISPNSKLDANNLVSVSITKAKK